VKDRPNPAIRATSKTLRLRNTIKCTDNLTWMRRLPDGCCDLIYADPPFNVNRQVGGGAGGAPCFLDRYAGGRGGHLAFLEPRLGEMRRLFLLKRTRRRLRTKEM
jgi:DNA modification methylase